MINRAFEGARSRHPVFCDTLLEPDTQAASVKASLAEVRDLNSHGPCSAENILTEEILEAIEAYLERDYRQCIRELSQAAAVIVRMMYYVRRDMISDEKQKRRAARKDMANAEN